VVTIGEIRTLARIRVPDDDDRPVHCPSPVFLSTGEYAALLFRCEWKAIAASGLVVI